MSEKQYGVVAPDVLLSYSGLDFLQAMIDGKVPNPPISQVLNFHLAEVSEGRAVFEGMPDASFYNPIGTVHGGFAMTLLNSALGCAIFTTLAKGEKWTTLEMKVNLVRPILEGYRTVAGRRTRDPSRPHRRDLRRRAEGQSWKALRARHNDVHDLSEDVKAIRPR